jgi:hypothetical protein
LKRPDSRLPDWIIRNSGHEHANVAHPLLRARHNRPRRGRAAEEGDELASRHSITSSASC